MAEIIRSEEEIINYYKEDTGFEFRADVLQFLPFEKVKHLFKEEYIKKVESGEEQYLQKSDPLLKAREYIEFAWSKANTRRGLSSSRSISHFINWFWLIDEDFYQKLRKLEDESYCPYGKPILVIVSEKLGIDWKKFDDGRWCEDEDGEDWPFEKIEEAILEARQIIN